MKNFDPAVVLIPSVQNKSFMPIGIPSNKPNLLLLEIFLSAFSAISRALSNVLVIKEFEFEFYLIDIKGS